MARLASTVLVLALLGATAAAFAWTEDLKSEPAPIFGTHVGKVVSSVCRCGRPARIEFRVRKPGRLALRIVGENGAVVRTLLRPARRAGRVRASWDGRNDAGDAVPEGRYKPRIDLRGRGLELPNPIRVDNTPPTVRLIRPPRPVLSPNGDGVADGLNARYSVSEPAHGLLLVDGRRVARTRFERREAQLEWYGRVGGRTVRSGPYRVSVAAEDAAGNRSRPSRSVVVTVRSVPR